MWPYCCLRRTSLQASELSLLFPVLKPQYQGVEAEAVAGCTSLCMSGTSCPNVSTDLVVPRQLTQHLSLIA